MRARADHVRWGVLGCGRMAAVMANAIQRSKNSRVVAVAAGRDLERARQFAARFGVATAYGSYRQLLEDADVQVVYVSLVNTLHREWTITAARSGKHVLCEKPLACTLEDARAMVAACRAAGVLLTDGFAYRFQPQNLQVRQLVGSGRIGQLIWMTAVHSSSRPATGDPRLARDLGGGTTLDKGCYCVNMARFLMGTEPESVFAHAVIGPESGVDERMTALLRFPGGRSAVFESGFNLADGSYVQEYQAWGTDGRIVVPGGFAQVETFRRGEIVDAQFSITSGQERETVSVPGVNQWQLEAEYFSQCVRDATAATSAAPPEAGFPAENGLENTRVLDAIFASARTGQPVALQPT